MSGITTPEQWLKDIVNTNDDFKPPPVTPESSLGIPVVWHAVNKIAGDIGQFPLCPYLEDGDTKQKDKSHPAYWLLTHEPNPIQGAMFFKEMLTAHALLWGNGRAYIVRNSRGEPIELIPMMPDRCETYLINGEKFHTYQVNTDERVPRRNEQNWLIPDADVLHVPAISLNGIAGISVVAYAKRAIGVASASEARTAKQVTKGFTGRLMYEAPVGVLNRKEDAEEFLANARRTHDASEEGELIGLLREGIKANVINMPNSDMQFLETRAFSKKDLMLLFGLETLPGDPDSVSYNSESEKKLSYVQGALSRWSERWVSACNRRLLSETEKRQATHYFKFNFASALRGTTKERYDVYMIGRQGGWLSVNDVRKLEDLNPIQGGDVYANPAITPGTGSNTSSESEGETQEANARLLMLENLIKTECSKAVNVASKNRNFLAWMDDFYPKWEAKIGDLVSQIGGDPAVAREYCEESKRQLLEVTNNCTQEGLLEGIEKCVSDWPERAKWIVEQMEGCNV